MSRAVGGGWLELAGPPFVGAVPWGEHSTETREKQRDSQAFARI
jgi:hypothetical protein